MTEERPEDARGPEDTAGPADGVDGQEARRASGEDAPFHGLRSAADIFGAPRGADDWPSRRERREAERSAKETGAPLPEPFVPEDEPESGTSTGTDAGTGAGAVSSAPAPLDDGATQAISMPEQLAAPSENPTAAVEYERSTLHDRIPPPAAVPPAAAAPHPSSISLPTAQTHRDERAAASRAVDAERRRVDPFGEGRADVDWLGRATGPGVVPTGPVAQQPPGVENVLPPTEEPPSFTDLLRLDELGRPASGVAGADRPFDWAIRDDEAGEVPSALTADTFDTTTTSTGSGSWSLAAESDEPARDDATPAHGVPPVLREFPVPPAVPAAAAAAATAPAAPGPGAMPPSDATEALGASRAPGRDDAADATPGLPSDAPTTAMPAADVWWDDPDATVPPTAAPPLVEPAAGTQAYPAALPPEVGQDLDALLGLRTDHRDDDRSDERPATLPGTAPDDLDQSEWAGRETSDTSAIKDLFGTEAVDQLGGTGYDPQDTGTRMMPAAVAPSAGVSAANGQRAGGSSGAGGASGGRDNFINEGVARLRSEGTRGKQLLIGASVVLILVLVVAVFLLTLWIRGNGIAEQTAPTRSPAAAASTAAATPSTTPSAPPSSEAAESGTTLQFATTPALPGEHPWTDLAGGECLSPFTNAWSQTFTVVDCATPHIAQLTARIPVTADAYPGAEALGAQAAEQCQSDAALNASAAAAVGDVQVQGSYAPDQQTWDQGDHFLSCFVTRSSGQPLTGSLAPA